jgi:hypothetical protein
MVHTVYEERGYSVLRTEDGRKMAATFGMKVKLHAVKLAVHLHTHQRLRWDFSMIPLNSRRLHI